MMTEEEDYATYARVAAEEYPIEPLFLAEKDEIRLRDSFISYTI